RRQVAIVPPPVQSYLLCFVERAHQKPDTDGEELYLSQGNSNVPGNDEPLVEHAVEHVDQTRPAMMRPRKLKSHESATITRPLKGGQPRGGAGSQPSGPWRATFVRKSLLRALPWSARDEPASRYPPARRFR